MTLVLAVATAARQARRPDPDPADPRPGRARRAATGPGSCCSAVRCGAVALIASVLLLRQPRHLPPAGAGRRGSLLGLRVRTFEHIHRLSHGRPHETTARRSRRPVTSDVETLAQFTRVGRGRVDRRRCADRRHARRDARLLVAARARRGRRVPPAAAAVPLPPAPPAARPTTRSARASAARSPRCPSSSRGAPVVLAYGLQEPRSDATARRASARSTGPRCARRSGSR